MVRSIRSTALLIAIVTSACGGAASITSTASPTAAPTTSPTPTASAGTTTTPPVAVPAGAIRFVAGPKSAATVRVEEHLAVNLINTDAVLVSPSVAGTLTLKSDGTFTPDSKITVDMTKLKSDQDLRDKWLSIFAIQTATFKESTFVPTRAVGLPLPLPDAGTWTFTLEGTLTVKTASKPVSWKTTLTRSGRDLTGTATTTVQWATFSLEKPQPAVFQVVSVSEDIRLELSFVGTQSD